MVHKNNNLNQLVTLELGIYLFSRERQVTLLTQEQMLKLFMKTCDNKACLKLLIYVGN